MARRAGRLLQPSAHFGRHVTAARTAGVRGAGRERASKHCWRGTGYAAMSLRAAVGNAVLCVGEGLADAQLELLRTALDLLHEVRMRLPTHTARSAATTIPDAAAFGSSLTCRCSAGAPPTRAPPRW